MTLDTWVDIAGYWTTIILTRRFDRDLPKNSSLPAGPYHLDGWSSVRESPPL